MYRIRLDRIMFIGESNQQAQRLVIRINSHNEVCILLQFLVRWSTLSDMSSENEIRLGSKEYLNQYWPKITRRSHDINVKSVIMRGNTQEDASVACTTEFRYKMRTQEVFI